MGVITHEGVEVGHGRCLVKSACTVTAALVIRETSGDAPPDETPDFPEMPTHPPTNALPRNRLNLVADVPEDH